MEETGTHDCVNCSGPISELVIWKSISACRLRFLALQSVSTDQAILVYLVGLEFANQKIHGVSLSFFDRNEDLPESALAVLLATINMLLSCTLIWLQPPTCCRSLILGAAALRLKRDVFESQG